MYKPGWQVISCPEHNGLPEFEPGARFSEDEMRQMLQSGWWPTGIVFENARGKRLVVDEKLKRRYNCYCAVCGERMEYARNKKYCSTRCANKARLTGNVSDAAQAA